MAERASVEHLMLTHLIPSLKTPSQGPFVVPGGPLESSDFESAVRDGGFTGKVHVGEDLMSVRLP
jgi:ribonuclease BN (tRNA processing enzyme)